jgi:hypothetical protein
MNAYPNKAFPAGDHKVPDEVTLDKMHAGRKGWSVGDPAEEAFGTWAKADEMQRKRWNEGKADPAVIADIEARRPPWGVNSGVLMPWQAQQTRKLQGPDVLYVVRSKRVD